MRIKVIAGAGFLCALFSCPAWARDQIRVVGSSTVYPFVTAAAEQFGENGTFKTPIIESTGTGGGFKLFCEGGAEDTPDINDASRKIAASETASCQQNGVGAIAEIPIGYDGIIIAGKKGAVRFNLSKRDLFLALARDLPDAGGAMVKNPNRRWHDVDPQLPDLPILLYGPPTTSGTRDTFVELVMEEGCKQVEIFAKAIADKKVQQNACRLLREDGRYIESGENYNVVVQKLDNNEQALGIMGYSYYEENRATLQAALIDGVMPDLENIESGKYGISRKLYLYVKETHIGIVPGIGEFLQEVTSEAAMGPDGYMAAKGLLPLNDQDRSASRAAAEELKEALAR